MRRRRGLALVWALLAVVLAAVLLGILWGQGAESRSRARRLELKTRARLLGEGALAHGLHKVENTVAYFDARLKGRAELDVGATDPGYMEDLRGRVEYRGGGGTYRVVSLVVRRRENTRGEGVLRVRLAAEAAVESGGQRWRERVESEYRLFGRRAGES